MIRKNKKYFESRVEIAKLLFQEKLYEDCINYIEATAKFAWMNFSGYYTYQKLEQLLENISKKVFPNLKETPNVDSDTRKILHICSEVYETGGHSKLLYNWIESDVESNHHIFATRMSPENLSEISQKYINTDKVKLIGGLRGSKIETASLLRAMATDYDFIILHIHPDDAVASIALSNLQLSSPLLFLNHADHVFWLGTGILDYLVQIRNANIKLDAERRGISVANQFFLPIPINVKPTSTSDENRKIIHLLSTGTQYKYKPNEKYNFLKEAMRIVERYAETVFHIVGIHSESTYAKEFAHERIVCHGILPPDELAKLESETDIYVEGFPMVSFTALLQLALQKKAFILHYNALPIFRLFEENNNQGIFYPKNLDQWHEEIGRLISDASYRKTTAEKQFEYTHANYSIQAWKDKLDYLYSKAVKQQKPLYKNSEEKFFEGSNEQLLSTINKSVTNHYKYTNNLPRRKKLAVVHSSLYRNQNVFYCSHKRRQRILETIKYLLKG